MSDLRIVPPSSQQLRADPAAPHLVAVEGHREALALATSTAGLGIEFGDGERSVLRLGAEDLAQLASELRRRDCDLGTKIERYLRPLAGWAVRGGAIDLAPPCLVGIVNLTGDSFSGDGIGRDIVAALRQANAMRDGGARVIDVGAESARADRPVLDEEVEGDILGRAVEALVAEGHTVSADTYKPAVARAAASAGAHILNDISGLTLGTGVAEIAAAAGTGYVLNYSYSVPKHRPGAPPQYRDVVLETNDWFESRLASLEGMGLARECIAIDPGIAFGKSHDEDLQVLRRLAEFRLHGQPILLAHSRKNFIGSVTGAAPAERDIETHVATALARAEGASIFRVHDVAGAARALEIAEAILNGVPGDFAPNDESWPWRAGAEAGHMTGGEPDKLPPPGQRW